MSLVSLEFASRLIGMPSEPAISRIWGDGAENESLPHNNLGRAISVVLDHLMEKVAFTGSAVSRAREGVPVTNSNALDAMRKLVGKEILGCGDYMIHEKMIEGVPQTIKTIYHESAYYLDRMPKMSYFMLKLILSFGQNIDIHGYHKAGKYEGANQKLMTILSLANQKLVNGGGGVFSIQKYFNRFESIHLEMAGDTTGGFSW